MSTHDYKRAERVSERIREGLMDLLIRGVLRDPRAKDVVISEVRLTDDLSIARVYIRLMGEVSTDRSDQAVDAMTRATGFIRRELGQRLGLRRVPDLEFFWDDVVDNALRLEAIFSELDTEETDDGDAGERDP